MPTLRRRTTPDSSDSKRWDVMDEIRNNKVFKAHAVENDAMAVAGIVTGRGGRAHHSRHLAHTQAFHGAFVREAGWMGSHVRGAEQ